jgi:host factor-I protein
MGSSSMKPGQDSAAVGRAPAKEKEEFVSRKLIRPSLSKLEMAEGIVAENGTATTRERPAGRRKIGRSRAKNDQPSVEHTHAEDFYYQKQMAAKTTMTVVLKNGEVVHGVIEWYDRNCIKLNRVGKPNLLLYKPGIRYMHKSDESR